MAEPRVIGAVIFDVDGTLIDSVDHHARCWVEALLHFGVEIPFEDIRVQIGKGGDQLLQGLIPPDMLRSQGEEIERFRSALFQKNYLPQVKAFPGVRELFQGLKARGQKSVLASSASSEELARFKDIAGIADMSDDATSSDDADRSKPFPDIFQAARARLGPPLSAQAVVVGDTPYDAEAARNAGLKSIGVLCGGFPEEALRSAGCISVFKDPADLLANLDVWAPIGAS